MFSSLTGIIKGTIAHETTQKIKSGNIYEAPIYETTVSEYTAISIEKIRNLTTKLGGEIKVNNLFLLTFK